MRDLLWFEWEKDLEGYAIAHKANDYEWLKMAGGGVGERIEEGIRLGKVDFDEEPSLIPVGGEVLRYRPFELGSAIFREFAATPKTHSGIQAFAAKYGRLGGISWLHEPVFHWYRQIDDLARAVDTWEECVEEGDLTPLARVFNVYDLGQVTLKFGAARFGERPRLRLEPASLLDAMWIQFGQMADGDAQLKRCDWCPTWFATGSSTGRRSTARFCSDTCRKASNRHEKGK